MWVERRSWYNHRKCLLQADRMSRTRTRRRRKLDRLENADLSAVILKRVVLGQCREEQPRIPREEEDAPPRVVRQRARERESSSEGESGHGEGVHDQEAAGANEGRPVRYRRPERRYVEL